MDWSRPPPAVWADPRIAVRRSAIDGRGLVATRAIVAGSVVVRLGGRVVGTDELAALIAAADADPSQPFVDTITVHEDQHLVLPAGSIAHFGNHGCDPNLWVGGPFELVARRSIDAGEEVTVDYATISGAGGLHMRCRCGSATCRGEVTSDDWRRPDLQARYGRHWVPALRDRIDLTSG